MKKIFVMAAAAMMAVMSVQAQDEFPRHEVAVSYGTMSNSEWINAFEHVITIMTTLGAVSYENDRYVGPFSVEYLYHPEDWIGVGGIFAYGQNKQDVKVLGNKTDELTHNYYTLMPAVKLDWLRKKYFGMYSKFAVGATLHTQDLGKESDSAVHLNWQASFLGIEGGSPNVRLFAELGCGEQGILLGGLRCKF